MVSKFEFTDVHFFCGMGGFEEGFQKSVARFKDSEARFRNLVGIDNDPEACEDYRTRTGRPAVCTDVATMEVDDVRRATGGVPPDLVAASPPCKAHSGLISNDLAATPRYRAMAELTLRWLCLTLEAWPQHPPKLIVMENVPRITSRGRDFLDVIRQLLPQHGYAIHEAAHNCGELGGLAQNRHRYLIVARHREQVPVFVFRPPRRRVRPIGDVLSRLVLPNDPAGGPHHLLPKITWRTWMRLALIRAGKDWRDLPLSGSYAILKESRPNLLGIADWNRPTGTVTGNAQVSGSNGIAAVSDPRVDYNAHRGKYGVMKWDQPSRTVIGGPANGADFVCSPAPGEASWFGDVYRVVPWDQPSGTITARANSSTGGFSVQDVRLRGEPRNDVFGVIPWNEPSGTVVGAADVHAARAAVQDPMERDNGEERPWPSPVILSPHDGCWHRPLTTRELAEIQSLRMEDVDGRPLVMAGNNSARHRMRIGNAVPPDAAESMGEVFLTALTAAALGQTFMLGGEDVWVIQDEEPIPMDLVRW